MRARAIRRFIAGGVAFATIVALVAVSPGISPVAAAEDSATLSQSKTVVGAQTQFAPGDTFQYEIEVGCSSTIDDGCFHAALTDTLPAPLILDPGNPTPVTASASPTATVDISLTGANGFTVRPVQAPGTPLQPGLRAGGSMIVTVSVMVPTTTGGEYNGQTITNTSTADADNALPVTASADITLAVTTTLVASLTKTVSPTSTIPAVPGRPVDWTLTPGNASNQTVDTITVQDPATPPGGFAYLDVTGVDIVNPAGTTARALEYYVGGTWTAVPPNPLSDAGGVRVTFTGTFAPAATGSVVIHSVTDSSVATIPDGDTVSVANDASTTVGKAGLTSDPVTADASITIAAQDPDVTITKSFADSTLVSGQSTTALIVATNGAQDVQRMTVTEPSAGSPGFTAQGLEFTGFADGVQWPVEATSATITYTYSDCASQPLTTATLDSLPAAQAGCTVEGFVVMFEAVGDGIAAGSYTSLPLAVTALPVDTLTPVQSTNVVDTEVVNAEGSSGTDDAAAPFTVDPLRVDTVVSKTITPDQAFAVPGADATVSLSGKVSDDSTIGSTSLIISDPADPAASTAFWNAFAPTSIRDTDIPLCSALTLRYWSESAGTWTDFPGASGIAGAVTGWSYDIPADLRSDIGGIQFEFDPTCELTLPPGFTVLPNIGVEVREYSDTQAVYANDVQSAVHNDDAVVPDATDEAEDSVTVIPIDDGPGPDLVDKTWLQDSVPALSSGVRTARLLWSTAGLNLTTMTLTDPATQGELDSVATSVYDAFDLVTIKPITPAVDPLIVNDVVSSVERYSDASNSWVDITAAACAAGCTGTFGGYTLTAPEQLDTLGIRVTLTERTAGAGVGSSYDRRPFDLDFRVRDTLRSDPSQYALGTFHPYTYNTTNPGLVNNTVSVRGTNPSIDFDRQSTDADTITIIDSPINVGLTKTFDQEALGLPAAGTPAADYPLLSATITATNDSAAKIASMVIDDPAATQSAPTAFETLNLYSIDAVTPPSPLTAAGAQITLTRTGGTDSPISIAEAQALTPFDLADVIGISVRFSDGSGRPVIASGATGTLGLTWQLRELNRSTGTPVTQTQPGGSPIPNIAHTALDSPGRIVCPADGCSTGETTATDSFDIVAADYVITTGKTISPSSVAENGSKNYTNTLTARPTGNARTSLMTVTDTTPTFWNTMDFTSARITVPRPVNQVAMDVLVDDDATRNVDYELVAGQLIATCNGTPLAADSPCWSTGDWVSANSGTSVTFTLPADVLAPQVVGVRFRAQQLVNGQVVVWERPFNPQLSYVVSAQRRDTLRSDPAVPVSTTRPGIAPNPGETDPGRITNTSTADGNARFGPQQTFTDHQEATASTVVTHPVNAIKVTKTRGTAAIVNPSGLVNYTMTVENTGRWDMTGFAVVDRIDPVDGSSPLVEPAPTQYGFAVTGAGAPSGAAGFSASLDPATGTVAIMNSDPNFVFRAGWRLTITAGLAFRPGLSPDTVVTNTVTATSDRDFERCESTSTDLVPKALQTNVAECSANTAVSPRSSATVSLKKWVKGDGAGEPATPADDDLGVLNVAGEGPACDPAFQGTDSDGFYSYPCAPITRPGGEETWRLDFFNTGNTNAKVIAAVDTLPALGDQGVIVSTPRGSQFPVSLVGKIESNIASLQDGASATVTAWYSTQVLTQACNTNAIQVETANAAPNPACAFNWTVFTSATPESALTTARSVKYVVTFANPNSLVPAPGLAPGETLSLTFNTRTPYALPKETAIGDGLSVAYNSFAGASRTAATATQPERAELVLEPQRVGVATATGQLQLHKIVDAPQFASPIQLPSSYPLLVTCVSGGEQVTLLTAAGADASRPSVNADGSMLIYDDPTGPVNLPLFSDCTVVEDPVPAGVTVTVDPAGSVVAERDLSADVRVWNPYAGDPQEAAFAITNTYSAGGFVVSKNVDAGGAVDANGDPIAYASQFSFDASCTYLGQEAVAEADRTFTLADTESQTFTGIPTGAECTVTETDTGGAASTSVDGVEQTGTPTSQFTIVAGETPATTTDFVNHYTVGSVEVTKSVTGAGADAWGQGPFTLQLVCTFDAAVSQPVYSATHDVTPADPTWRVDDLPTGSECAVSELDDAGATESSLEPEDGIVTVGVAGAEGGVALVSVTNDFRVGGLEVSKELDGPGVADFGAGPFLFSAVCTYEGDEVYTGTLTVTGDGSGDPLVSETVTGIPVGAECVVTETDDGGADETPAPKTVTIPDEVEGVASVVSVDFTNYFSVAELTLTKVLEGDGAAADYATSAVFTVLVTCQLEAEDGSLLTLLSASYDIAGGETITLTDADGNPVRIPTGAHCFGTETVTGGATASVVNPDTYEAGLVVEPGAEVQTLALVATNTFDLGSLEITKTVAGAAVAENSSKTFQLELTCVLDQGQQAPTVLKDREVISITGGQTVTISGLPIGAECWVAETDSGGADAVQISNTTAAMPAVVGAGSAITVVNTFAGVLPATGVDSTPLLIAGGIAGVLIIGGVILMIVLRRRRQN